MSFVRVVAVVLVAAAAMLGVRADDVGVTSARLFELPGGEYALEADITPDLAGALAPPIVPARFTDLGAAVYRRVGPTLVVRYTFAGSDEPLHGDDVLLLPWARPALLLTAHLAGDRPQSAMFDADLAGFRIPLSRFRPLEYTATEDARRRLDATYDDTPQNLLRLLLLLGLASLAGPFRATRLALVFVVGHGLSMVVLDLGWPLPQPVLAIGSLALGTMWIARSALRDHPVRLWPLLLLLGCLDGVGVAASIAELDPRPTVAALFGALVGLDLWVLPAAVVLDYVRGHVERSATVRVVAAVVGVLSCAALLIAASSVPFVDPAVEIGDEARGFVPPPVASRPVDQPAMVFLAIESDAVRVEATMSIVEFVEQLAIDRAAGSVVSIEHQATLAERAARLVAQSTVVWIDGREAAPTIERTAFVVTTSGGVITRPEADPGTDRNGDDRDHPALRDRAATFRRASAVECIPGEWSRDSRRVARSVGRVVG